MIFAKGDIVKLSPEGLVRFPRKSELSWTVIGFGRKDKTVWIRPKGQKYSECYHQNLLKKMEETNG